MAQEVIRDGAEMVRTMRPERMPGAWVFRSMPMAEAQGVMPDALAMFQEAEGVSLLLPGAEGDADAMAQITLQVFSALDGVGLTAAVSTALAREGIPANVIAATHHDHVFVPIAMADRALTCLQDLAKAAAAPSGGA